jgi:APA family basic amino acid/polyamine antiporter
MLYLRKKKNHNKNKMIVASCISIPAFLYSLWAITGLEYEVIIWGAILLSAGLPIYAYLKLRDRTK